ncbi:MAG: GNAT family N-acetyltransferase [Acidiferrobacteraceae bacterium]
MRIVGIEHVQLAMPPGEEQRARDFYTRILGIPEAPKPPELAQRGGVWFERPPLKLHIGVETDFRPARKAHPGLLVENLERLVTLLRGAGYPVIDNEPLETFLRVYVSDPFGNRIELMEPLRRAGHALDGLPEGTRKPGRHNKTTMNIRVATTDTEIAACYPVMRELRPHIAEDHFLPRVQRQQAMGYCLAFVQEPDGAVAVAGFRIAENLAWGRFLYVDDLVTLPAHRSKGYGAELLSWLKEHAKKDGCTQFHLDSGIQRHEAHRFYEREGMTTTCLHFAEHIRPNNASVPDAPKRRSD